MYRKEQLEVNSHDKNTFQQCHFHSVFDRRITQCDLSDQFLAPLYESINTGNKTCAEFLPINRIMGVSKRTTTGKTVTIRLRLHGAIYRPDSFVLMLRYCANLKEIRYESTSLNRIVADKSHRVTVAKNTSQHSHFQSQSDNH